MNPLLYLQLFVLLHQLEKPQWARKMLKGGTGVFMRQANESDECLIGWRLRQEIRQTEIAVTFPLGSEQQEFIYHWPRCEMLAWLSSLTRYWSVLTPPMRSEKCCFYIFTMVSLKKKQRCGQQCSFRCSLTICDSLIVQPVFNGGQHLAMWTFFIILLAVFVHLGWPGLICLELHPATVARWQSLRVCGGCVTVISHQSEAAEPHIDILGCKPACLPRKK